MRSVIRGIVDRWAPFPVRRPLFVIAPPRSGSTFLFECLSQFRELYGLKKEADSIWWDLFPYDRCANPSDEVLARKLTGQLQRALRIRKYRKAVVAHAQRHRHRRYWGHRLGLQPIRYLDKTIANCFHLEVLAEVFPDAQYVFLVRDPRANISSMIEGWRCADRFGKPQLAEIVRQTRGATVERWVYPAPPGWQEQLQRPLPEICAWSWKQHVQAALDFFGSTTPPVHKVHYEDLRDSTIDVIGEIAAWADLSVNDCVRRLLQDPPQSRTTVSEPQKEKWKRKNPEAIRSVLPIVRKTALRIGYDV